MQVEAIMQAVKALFDDQLAGVAAREIAMIVARIGITYPTASVNMPVSKRGAGVVNLRIVVLLRINLARAPFRDGSRDPRKAGFGRAHQANARIRRQAEATIRGEVGVAGGVHE